MLFFLFFHFQASCPKPSELSWKGTLLPIPSAPDRRSLAPVGYHSSSCPKLSREPMVSHSSPYLVPVGSSSPSQDPVGSNSGSGPSQ